MTDLHRLIFLLHKKVAVYTWIIQSMAKLSSKGHMLELRQLIPVTMATSWWEFV